MHDRVEPDRFTAARVDQELGLDPQPQEWCRGISFFKPDIDIRQARLESGDRVANRGGEQVAGPDLGGRAIAQVGEAISPERSVDRVRGTGLLECDRPTGAQQARRSSLTAAIIQSSIPAWR